VEAGRVQPIRTGLRGTTTGWEWQASGVVDFVDGIVETPSRTVGLGMFQCY